jgi:hypothetical protein
MKSEEREGCVREGMGFGRRGMSTRDVRTEKSEE